MVTKAKRQRSKAKRINRVEEVRQAAQTYGMDGIASAPFESATLGELPSHIDLGEPYPPNAVAMVGMCLCGVVGGLIIGWAVWA